MKSDFIIDKPQGKRWDFALDILQEGKVFIYQGIAFVLDTKHKVLRCDVAVDVHDPRTITEQRAQTEFEAAKGIVDELIKDSNKFQKIVSGCKIKYSIVCDYDTGIMKLFSVLNGKVQKV